MTFILIMRLSFGVKYSVLGFGAIGPKSERQRKMLKHNRPPGGGGEKSLSSGRHGAHRPGTALYSLCAPCWERIIDLPRRWGQPRSAFCLPIRCCRASGRVLVTPDISPAFAPNPGLWYTGHFSLSTRRGTGLVTLSYPATFAANLAGRVCF